MSMLDRAAANTDQADLVILNNVEILRDQMQPATASAVASFIGGAPIKAIAQRLLAMSGMGLVEIIGVNGWQLTEMGAELLRRELDPWSPSEREERRRWDALMEASMRRI